MSKRLDGAFWVACVVAFLVPLFFSQAVRYPFFSDDIPKLTYLNTATLADIFGRVDMQGTYYRPFVNVLYWLLPPSAPLWHMILVWVHLLNTVLVYALVRLLLPSLTPYTLPSMLVFALFPFAVQAVVWVDSGTHLAVTLWVLVASVASVLFMRSGALLAYLFALMGGLFAPFSHETGILTTPIVASVLFAIEGRLMWQRPRVWGVLLPIGAFAVLYWGMRSHALAGVSEGFALNAVGAMLQNSAFLGQAFAYYPALFFTAVPFLSPELALGLAIAVTGFLGWRLWRVAEAHIQRVLGMSVVWMLLGCAPSVVLLNPQYVANGERLVLVVLPAIAIFWAVLVAYVIARLSNYRLLQLFSLSPFLVAIFANTLNPTYSLLRLHDEHAQALNTFIHSVEALPGETRLLTINLPSVVERRSRYLPFAYEKANLLTDWIELRDFLTVNTGTRFESVSYAYVPELMPEDNQFRHVPYGNLTPLAQLTDLIRHSDRIYKTTFLPQARLETRLIGTRETSLKPPLAQFGGFLDLVQATATQQADRLAVTLTWQLSNADSVGFESVFVHVMQGEALVAQQDGAPLENLYPFSAWRKGDVWTETRFVLGVPRGCADCEIRVGVYRWSDGERAPVTNAQGEIIGTGWTLKAE